MQMAFMELSSLKRRWGMYPGGSAASPAAGGRGDAAASDLPHPGVRFSIPFQAPGPLLFSRLLLSGLSTVYPTQPQAGKRGNSRSSPGLQHQVISTRLRGSEEKVVKQKKLNVKVIGFCESTGFWAFIQNYEFWTNESENGNHCLRINILLRVLMKLQNSCHIFLPRFLAAMQVIQISLLSYYPSFSSNNKRVFQKSSRSSLGFVCDRNTWLLQ